MRIEALWSFLPESLTGKSHSFFSEKTPMKFGSALNTPLEHPLEAFYRCEHTSNIQLRKVPGCNCK